MRVVLAVAAALAVALVAGAQLAIGSRAEPSATRVESTYLETAQHCTMTDDRLATTSGLAALGTDLWVLQDEDAVLYRLDERCAVVETVDLAERLAERDVRLRDVEDLAVGPDGWLWIADIGGNRSARARVQVVGYQPSSERIRVARLDYPSGTHDAEAMVVGVGGFATLVTKSEDEAAVFTATQPLVDGATIPLVRRGTVPLDGVVDDAPGARLVTGAALSRSGVFLALRTYTTGLEFDLVDGDVATALVDGTPRRVPLPESPQGEAIAYAADGTALFATGEGVPMPVDRVVVTRTVVEGP